jgi:hypothetical protein
MNITPELARKLKKVGILAKKDFLAEDPYIIFHILRKNVSSSLGKEALASIVGASLNLPWQAIAQVASSEYDRRYPQNKLSKS